VRRKGRNPCKSTDLGFSKGFSGFTGVGWGDGIANAIKINDLSTLVETLVRVVREFASNPTLQSALLFDRVLFNWVIGNGDMHLKNWSLIENGPLIELAPAYDFLRTVLLVDDEEESALELADRKSEFDRELLLEAFGRELCGLQPARIERSLRQLKQVDWAGRIKACALSESLKTAYLDLVKNRMERLE
jgi:serine/threonine-protein kinase HipA